MTVEFFCIAYLNFNISFFRNFLYAGHLHLSFRRCRNGWRKRNCWTYSFATGIFYPNARSIRFLPPRFNWIRSNKEPPAICRFNWIRQYAWWRFRINIYCAFKTISILQCCPLIDIHIIKATFLSKLIKRSDKLISDSFCHDGIGM